MMRLAALVRHSRFGSAFEHCAIAALIALVVVGGTHGFGPHLGIVFNNASKLAE